MIDEAVRLLFYFHNFINFFFLNKTVCFGKNSYRRQRMLRDIFLCKFMKDYVRGKGRKGNMKRNRKNGMKKERVIMLASSAFVLAALTMTGLYMKNSNTEAKDDGYTLDFTAMEDNANNKFEEIARNEQEENITNQVADNSIQNQTGNTTFGNSDMGVQEEVTEDDLDYMPLEVGSGTIEIPGLTEKSDSLV